MHIMQLQYTLLMCWSFKTEGVAFLLKE